MDLTLFSTPVVGSGAARRSSAGPSSVTPACTMRQTHGFSAQGRSALERPRQPRFSRSGAASAHRRNILRVACDATAEAQRSQPSNVADALRELGSQDSGKRNRVVVLGSGWGALSFVRELNAAWAKLPAGKQPSCSLTVISPTPFCTYTPLLPAVAVGKVDANAVIQPIIDEMKHVGHYIRATARRVDPKAQTVTIDLVDSVPGESPTKTVHYDTLIVTVGSNPNTVGMAGISENCQPLKTLADAQNVNRRLKHVFEMASAPGTSPEDIAKLLSFVVVGGGPTGLEVAAQLYDQAEALRAKLMPTLSPDVVRVTVVELRDSVLSGVDKDIAAFAARRFSRSNVHTLLNARVMQADPNLLTLVNLSSNGDDVLTLPFGLCVWCTGLGMNPLVKQIASQLAIPSAQRHSRALVVDGLLRVKGTKPGSMFAVGDAAWVDPAALHEAGCLLSSLPATAVVAKDQGEWLARSLMANPEAASIVEAAEKMQNAEGKEVTHFSYKHKAKGSPLDVGAVEQVAGDTSPVLTSLWQWGNTGESS